ncbi:hypothetical protein GCM10027203_34990 [Nonomuraea fastidiosa]
MVREGEAPAVSALSAQNASPSPAQTPCTSTSAGYLPTCQAQATITPTHPDSPLLTAEPPPPACRPSLAAELPPCVCRPSLTVELLLPVCWPSPTAELPPPHHRAATIPPPPRVGIGPLWGGAVS